MENSFTSANKSIDGLIISSLCSRSSRCAVIVNYSPMTAMQRDASAKALLDKNVMIFLNMATAGFVLADMCENPFDGGYQKKRAGAMAGPCSPSPCAALLQRLEFIEHLIDRKSTRLNSSHANISYAVFCLKKKKKTKT